MGFSTSDFWVLKISRRFAAFGLSVSVVSHWYLWRFWWQCHTPPPTHLSVFGRLLLFQ
jgi:hypothetical protein